MENVTFIEIESMGVTTEFALLDHGNDQFSSMPKGEYERLQAEQSTPNLAD
jgi:hypothetical protein